MWHTIMCVCYVLAPSKVELHGDVMAAMETKSRVEGLGFRVYTKLKVKHVSTTYTIPRVLPTSIWRALTQKIRWPTLLTNLKQTPTFESVWLGLDLKLNATKTCV